MSRPEFSIEIDGAQFRQARDRIGFSAGGDDFDTGQYFSDTWIDPVTSTLFLRPRCMYPAWYTSTTAPYDKLGLSDFGSPAGFVVAQSWTSGGSKFLQLLDTNPPTGTTITTTTTWPANTGMYVCVYNFSAGDLHVVAEFGWNDSSVIGSGTGCRLWSDGTLEVWRDGVQIVKGQVSGAKGPQALANNQIELLIIPCRRRELLIVSTAGNGVRAIMPDISDTATSPVILPNAKFWYKGFGSMSVMVAPLKYATSGYACSEPINLAEAPPTGASLETWPNPSWASGVGRVFGDKSYRTGATDAAVASLTLLDGATAFVPNGVRTSCRAKIALAGDGNASPGIYGVCGGYASTTATTNATEKANLGTTWQKIAIEVPETGGPSMTFELFNPTASGVVGLYDHCNKPVKVTLGSTVFHEGVSEPVEYTESTHPDSDKATLKSNPHLTQALKDYCFRERMVFDGMPISHASDDCLIRRLCRLVGAADSDLDLETATVTAGEIAPAVCGQFSEIADIGENGWDYLSRVMQDYLGGWWYGEYPGASKMKFTTKSPTTMNAAASKATLYRTTAAAIAAGKDPAEAWRYVWRERKRHRLRPEANEIVVTGFDPRYQWPVQAIKRDTASQDPTTAPSGRPANWLGQPSRLGVINNGINSQAVATGGAGLLYDRVTPAREINAVEVELPLVDDATGFPVWASDKVTLDGIGDFLVSSWTGGVEKDPNGFDQWMWRPVTLVVSTLVGRSDSAHYHDVVAWAMVNAARNTIARRGFVQGAITRYRVGSSEIL